MQKIFLPFEQLIETVTIRFAATGAEKRTDEQHPAVQLP